MADQEDKGGEQEEQDKAEQDKAEQDKAEQDKAEQDKAEQDKAEQAEQAGEAKAEGEGEIRPAEAFKKGMGLLWQAAKSAADEIKREVEKGQVTETLQQAGKELETAANHAAKALEDFIDRASPKRPKYEDKWPPDGDAKDGAPAKEEAPAPKQADADIPADGGTDESGERRDMRIQVEEDKKSNGKG